MSELRQLVFATNNAHKIEEAQAIVAGKLKLISLKEAGIDIDVDETGTTFHANALLKAQAIFDATGLACVADDSGLCVDALGGAPGVFSARYGGLPVDHAVNNDKLLRELKGVDNRKAQFKTVLCIVGLAKDHGSMENYGPLFFEGSVEGEILQAQSGAEGFGYDPMFRPDGFDQTFAQMLPDQKNALSHRGNAFGALMQFLTQNGAQVPAVKVADFDYDLIVDRIAFEAIEPRDASKLLVYKGSNGEFSIATTQFSCLGDELGPGDFLVANDTKVIPARLQGRLASGKDVEVFLLNPLDADWRTWEVMVGNRKKFKEGDRVYIGANDKMDGDFDDCLAIEWLDRERNRIQLILPMGFGDFPSAIEVFGKVPLPPYIERDVVEADKDRYQAIFAEKAGAVAAPTASLHFTDRLKDELLNGDVGFGYLTLHVGAGTFKPMTAEFASGHDMHSERFEITIQLVEAILKSISTGKRVVSIGTTVMRVLESLYFVGCRLIQGKWEGQVLSTDGYDEKLKSKDGVLIGMEQSLVVLRDYLLDNGGVMRGETQIFIVEGFEFRVVKGLITNFHQPKSTLLMLVSAFTGGNWRSIYRFAMADGYRFLSYGDGSLLWR